MSKTTIRTAALALAALTLGAGSALAQDLTITSWGGAYQKSQDEAYFKPYTAKTKIKITQEEYNGEISKIRAMVESGKTTWDAIDVDAATAQQGCDEGILLPIDYSKFGGKDKFVKGSTFECAVPTIIYSTIYAYDADKIKDGPKTIADLFDTKKWPGKRALQKTPFGNLEFALMADGVPVDKVYEVLKTKEGVDRAFKKLDTVKKDVVWWEAGAQPPQLLASGEVVMATAWNGRIFGANKTDKRNFKIVWDGQLQDWDLWAIPKGVKSLDATYAFLQFASSPEQQAEQTKYISYGPALAAATPHIAPDILKDLPTAPENAKTALANDPVFWGDNGEELRKRFNTWLAQ
ncbi:spermidine/putrescine ABC transporter substrate-binding protein [Prosthecomicrobium hirschii]|uniref:Spermidine/putrescine ABC transporter substrate-binding protein n=1 Tax=Prosthecodimorpha hirschii TaxID=665126 RepID=A0A0P6W504_9HYPH|nr:ABC transporter substrate-binding protein [Prosthecomicrobium hirschii]KPL53508.1 spermidine/putrescine ABC transporter substrate-binding protein [Prosthecomicrobium hirschii]TPQ48942.1 ABC transporter substrate-binding protein [Prosthecomicrobium hirschii]